jgi:8-oxo-dGTP pyrophosphatase MutT (NUDIX family)
LKIFPKAWYIWYLLRVFPGGKVDKGENFIDTCIREIKEEVGLEIRFSNNKFYYKNIPVEIEDLIAYESVYPHRISQGLPRFFLYYTLEYKP